MISAPTWNRVHPRACGGNAVSVACCPCAHGPSPRVRGKRLHRRDARGSAGSIPARAGETWSMATEVCRSRVHPRACGGKRGWEGGSEPSPGSIPARAGETWSMATEVCRSRVHPRACGGNVGGARALHGRQGPSPRVRGKRTPRGVMARPMGSIPARAGETSLAGTSALARGVHPRACGGNSHTYHAQIYC